MNNKSGNRLDNEKRDVMNVIDNFAISLKEPQKNDLK